MEKDRDSSNQNPSALPEEDKPQDVFAASGLLEEWPLRSWTDLSRKPQFVLDDDKGWEVV